MLGLPKWDWAFVHGAAAFSTALHKFFTLVFIFEQISGCNRQEAIQQMLTPD